MHNEGLEEKKNEGLEEKKSKHFLTWEKLEYVIT